MKIIISVLALLFFMNVNSEMEDYNYPKAKVSYSDFEELVKEVKKHRKQRLISFDSFLEKSKNVIILDTRSKYMYDRKHIKGAIHLNFSDFTQLNLNQLIPDTNTTILIYCNNNFDGDKINFATKSVMPKIVAKNIKPLTLALNIPTYINLYGYGYQNVYELNELISFYDERIEYEGSIIR